MNHKSLEQITREKYIAALERRDQYYEQNEYLKKQLADVMHENERLREALGYYKVADDGVYKMLAGFRATEDMEDPNSIAGIALRSNKDTDNGDR